MKIRAALVIVAIFGGWILGLVTGHVWFLPGEDNASVASMDLITGQEDSVVDEGHGLIQLHSDQIREFGIEIDTAGPTKLQTAIQLPGRIVLNAETVASIVPRVSGVAIKVGKAQGEKVAENEVMAVIDSRELADVKTNYLTAIERVTLLQATFDREATLWKERVSSEKDYIDAKQALAEAKIAQFNAEQKLHALGIGEADPVRLKSPLDASFTQYDVCAPFEGTVIERTITRGEPVFDTSPMFRIADLRTVWVEFGVHEDELGAIHMGQSITIKATGTDSRAQSIVAYISPMVSEITRMATLRVVLDNPGGTWRPGLFVTGLLYGEGVHVMVAVPQSAIQNLGGEKIIFLETRDGFKPQAIETGREDSTHVEIIGGLKPGQRYVKANAFTLKAELTKASFVDDDD